LFNFEIYIYNGSSHTLPNIFFRKQICFVSSNQFNLCQVNSLKCLFVHTTRIK
jgi:hypothetical protein